jgi:integrase
MPKKLPVWIEEEEFRKVIKATRRKHHKIAFLLAFEAGLRISEVVNLQPTEINLENKSILIKEAKGGKDRIVPLPKHWKQDHSKHLPLKCGIRSLQAAFRRAAIKSKITETKPTIHFHSLRHGFAKRLVDKGVPLNQVQILMGHSNVATTGIYVHANPKEALESYEGLF